MSIKNPHSNVTEAPLIELPLAVVTVGEIGHVGLLKVELTRFLLRRKCDFAQHNHFKLDRCQPPEPALATLAMIRPLDP